MIYPQWNETGISKRFISVLQSYCLKKDHIDKILLFGSRARGDYHRSSDIDLAVFTKESSHTQQNLIEQAINEMPTPLKIDVVFMDRLNKEKLISNIRKEGIVIYEQGKALREA
ncbi:nucleotidyltransferase domain-containing protein [Bacillus sp. V3B]|uniref:nucleotidyltransferase domain-containing protein n=1 Tax=Bacillus sp. V3B TaxID=2804915 RepID=UPI00210B6DFB|nr:nucleotidyltransferase domain-containing protein [Bacillus sp. V3B]MCQ6275927.1 nucleotidyltransferase domain-containing protein [Bacillus sp. V3B]